MKSDQEFEDLKNRAVREILESPPWAVLKETDPAKLLRMLYMEECFKEHWQELDELILDLKNMDRQLDELDRRSKEIRMWCQEALRSLDSQG